MRAVTMAIHLAVLSLPTAPAALGQLPGPSLILRDSLILQEDAEYYVSAPIDVVQGTDGSLLISDAFANAILQFDGDGRFVRAFGGPGQGPGEFMGVGPVMTAGGLVGAVDFRGMEIEVFDYQTGEPTGAIGLRPTFSITSMTQVGDSVWIAGMDRNTWMSVGAVAATELPSLARTGSEESLRLERIAVPSPYQTNPIMFGALGHAFLDVGESDIVVGFSGTPYLLLSRASEPIDTLHLQPRLRRGVPAEEDVRTPTQAMDPVLFANEISVLGPLSRDDDGNIIVVHTDPLFERAAGRQGPQVSDIRTYVSSTSPDGTRQCADTEIPIASGGRPRVALEGSLLLVVDQIPSARGEVSTVVRRFEVDPLTCDGEVR
ncbi:MAG: 6-bladed beta-propeller [Gemmatimonadetes bacterium]|nr:6-bladed beta-propeller [Gemmatimonadota bacterium]MCY3677896.1 6-bladed beta-propeller [Gemmatimonadota bacterium]MYA43864.1 6-bladed beta-propeller [Gemmatimonadota bacterium]MYE93754.1 6-bladed beta-propeller [Gemmatimonadota bacterium]MYJ12264.1 6-bladed beta-propeller [Gemmatimonadota bacterium]